MIWNFDKLEYLKLNYMNMKYSEIADILGTTEKAVKAQCQKQGFIKVKRHTVNETFFDTWSCDMAYILGYIMADGYIQNDPGLSRFSLQLCLHKRDISFLEFLNSKLCPNNHIGINTNSDIITCRYTSKYMINKLAEFGVVQRKTGKETIKYIPDKFRVDFIRGFFDGDGCVCIAKNGNFSCYICSSNLEIIKDIRDYFNFGNIIDISKYRKNKNPFYNWSVTRKCDLEKFRNEIYKNGSFCLERKKSIIFDINTEYIKTRKYAIL